MTFQPGPPAFDLLAPPYSTETLLVGTDECLPYRQGSLPCSAIRTQIPRPCEKGGRALRRSESSAQRKEVNGNGSKLSCGAAASRQCSARLGTQVCHGGQISTFTSKVKERPAHPLLSRRATSSAYSSKRASVSSVPSSALYRNASAPPLHSTCTTSPSKSKLAWISSRTTVALPPANTDVLSGCLLDYDFDDGGSCSTAGTPGPIDSLQRSVHAELQAAEALHAAARSKDWQFHVVQEAVVASATVSPTASPETHRDPSETPPASLCSPVTCLFSTDASPCDYSPPVARRYMYSACGPSLASNRHPLSSMYTDSRTAVHMPSNPAATLNTATSSASLASKQSPSRNLPVHASAASTSREQQTHARQTLVMSQFEAAARFAASDSASASCSTTPPCGTHRRHHTQADTVGTQLAHFSHAQSDSAAALTGTSRLSSCTPPYGMHDCWTPCMSSLAGTQTNLLAQSPCSLEHLGGTRLTVQRDNSGCSHGTLGASDASRAEPAENVAWMLCGAQLPLEPSAQHTASHLPAAVGFSRVMCGSAWLCAGQRGFRRAEAGTAPGVRTPTSACQAGHWDGNQPAFANCASQLSAQQHSMHSTIEEREASVQAVPQSRRISMDDLSLPNPLSHSNPRISDPGGFSYSNPRCTSDPFLDEGGNTQGTTLTTAGLCFARSSTPLDTISVPVDATASYGSVEEACPVFGTFTNVPAPPARPMRTCSPSDGSGAYYDVAGQSRLSCAEACLRSWSPYGAPNQHTHTGDLNAIQTATFHSTSGGSGKPFGCSASEAQMMWEGQAPLHSCLSNNSCAPTELVQEGWCFCGGGDTIFGSACGCGGRASFADSDDSSCFDDSPNRCPCACQCHHKQDYGGSSATWECDCDCGRAAATTCSLTRCMHERGALEEDEGSVALLALNAMYGGDGDDERSSETISLRGCDCHPTPPTDEYACGDIDDSQTLSPLHACSKRVRSMHVPTVVTSDFAYTPKASPQVDADKHLLDGRYLKVLEGRKVLEGSAMHPPPSPHTPSNATAAQMRCAPFFGERPAPLTHACDYTPVATLNACEVGALGHSGPGTGVPPSAPHGPTPFTTPFSKPPSANRPSQQGFPAQAPNKPPLRTPCIFEDSLDSISRRYGFIPPKLLSQPPSPPSSTLPAPPSQIYCFLNHTLSDDSEDSQNTLSIPNPVTNTADRTKSCATPPRCFSPSPPSPTLPMPPLATLSTPPSRRGSITTAQPLRARDSNMHAASSSARTGLLPVLQDSSTHKSMHVMHTLCDMDDEEPLDETLSGLSGIAVAVQRLDYTTHSINETPFSTTAMPARLQSPSDSLSPTVSEFSSFDHTTRTFELVDHSREASHIRGTAESGDHLDSSRFDEYTLLLLPDMNHMASHQPSVLQHRTSLDDSLVDDCVQMPVLPPTSEALLGADSIDQMLCGDGADSEPTATPVPWHSICAVLSGESDPAEAEMFGWVTRSVNLGDLFVHPRNASQPQSCQRWLPGAPQKRGSIGGASGSFNLRTPQRPSLEVPMSCRLSSAPSEIYDDDFTPNLFTPPEFTPSEFTPVPPEESQEESSEPISQADSADVRLPRQSSQVDCVEVEEENVLEGSGGLPLLPSAVQPSRQRHIWHTEDLQHQDTEPDVPATNTSRDDDTADACAACVLCNRDSLDDSPCQTACDACEHPNLDFIDDVNAGTDASCNACELATANNQDSLLEYSTVESACNASMFHDTHDSLLDESTVDTACDACMLPNRRSLNDSTVETVCDAFTLPNRGSIDDSTVETVCDACTLPNRGSIDDSTVETDCNSIDVTRTHDLLMGESTVETACDEGELSPVVDSMTQEDGKSPSASADDTEVCKASLDGALGFAAVVSLTGEQSSGLCSFPGKHTSEMSGETSSVLSCTASLAHFAGSALLPLVDTLSWMPAPVAPHVCAPPDLVPPEAPPQGTFSQQARAPGPVASSGTSQKSLHTQSQHSLLQPTARSLGCAVGLRWHGHMRSHSTGAIASLDRDSFYRELRFDSDWGGAMHALERIEARHVLVRSKTMHNLSKGDCLF